MPGRVIYPRQGYGVPAGMTLAGAAGGRGFRPGGRAAPAGDLAARVASIKSIYIELLHDPFPEVV
jgi:hypothetical protein